MSKYHLNNDGEPAPCTATVRPCPVGGEHFSNEDDARRFYEQSQESFVIAQKKDPYAVSEKAVKETVELASSGRAKQIRVNLRMLEHGDYDMIKSYRRKQEYQQVVELGVQKHRISETIKTLTVSKNRSQKSLRNAKTEIQRNNYLKTVGETQAKIDQANKELREINKRVDNAKNFYEEKLNEYNRAVDAVSNYTIRDEAPKVDLKAQISKLEQEVAAINKSNVRERYEKASRFLKDSDADGLLQAAQAYGSKEYIEASENYKNRSLEIADQNAEIERLEIKRSNIKKSQASQKAIAEIDNEIEKSEAAREAAELSIEASKRKLALFRSEVKDGISYISSLDKELENMKILDN